MEDERPAVRRGETVCPACGGKLVPILYGLPSPEAVESADRGEGVLGGCILTGDDPHFACAQCRKRFWPYREKPRSAL